MNIDPQLQTPAAFHTRMPLVVPHDAPTPRRRRILVGKPGLDGHDRGAKYIVHLLRDAGYEVIYTGIRRSPEEIVAAAIHEDVDAIGLSVLSGAHLMLFGRVIELLHDQQAADIVVFGGGIIPPNDMERLKALGVAAVFTPGTSAQQILDSLGSLIGVDRSS